MAGATVVVQGIRGLRGTPGVSPEHAIGEEQLRAFFAQDGLVLDVHIAAGACWVQYADAAGAARCCRRDGTETQGHLLRVGLAQPQLQPRATLPLPRAAAPDWYPAGGGGLGGAGAYAAAPAGADAGVRGALNYGGSREGLGGVQYGGGAAPYGYAAAQGAYGGVAPGYEAAYGHGALDAPWGVPHQAPATSYGHAGQLLADPPAAMLPPPGYALPSGAFGGGVAAAVVPGVAQGAAPARGRTQQQPPLGTLGAGGPAGVPTGGVAMRGAAAGPPPITSYAAAAKAGAVGGPAPVAHAPAPPPVAAPAPAPAPRAFAPPPPHGRPVPQSAAAAAAAASAAASKLPLAAAISTVHQAVGSGPKREAAHTCVLKMRGLPFSARKADVIAFFGPAHAAGAWTGANLSEDSIHIVQEASGRPAGIAFAEFASAEEARGACAARNRKSMGARYVELFPSSRDEATRVATGGGKW